MKLRLKLFFATMLFLSSLGFAQEGTEDIAVEAISSPMLRELNSGDFSAYPDENEETQGLGSIKLTWESHSTNQIQVKFRYDDELEWRYSDIIASTDNTFQLDSIEANRILVWSIGMNEIWSDEAIAHTLTSDAIENFVVKGSEEAVKITWSINYNIASYFKKNNIMAVVSYNTDIGKKRAKEGMEGSEWMHTEPFSIMNNKTAIDGLIGNEKYHFKLGFAPKGELKEALETNSSMVWTSAVKEKTKRGWGLAKVLILIGSLGFFIYGMKLMSEGLQQAAGSMLRKMLGSITANRVKGVFTGFGNYFFSAILFSYHSDDCQFCECWSDEFKAIRRSDDGCQYWNNHYGLDNPSHRV